VGVGAVVVVVVVLLLLLLLHFQVVLVTKVRVIRHVCSRLSLS
jgi:hypothetical protein